MVCSYQIATKSQVFIGVFDARSLRAYLEQGLIEGVILSGGDFTAVLTYKPGDEGLTPPLIGLSYVVTAHEGYIPALIPEADGD